MPFCYPTTEFTGNIVSSIQEVAKRAGVSIATVSRTINNPAVVDPQTAARVWKAVEELHYVPNTQARALVSGHSRILGLIVSDITNPFFPELIKGFEDVAIQHGYEMMVSSTNYNSVRTEMCVRRMLERKVDGVAIMTSELPQAHLDHFARRNVPLVFLDAGNLGPGVSSIRVNYAKGINEAVQHLLLLGHRRIGFISGPLSLKSAVIRRSAFLDCLTKSGIIEDTCLIAEADHTVTGGLEAMSRLLSLPDPPTAVLASNDLTAIGTLRAVRQAGLRVPEDISAVGFDDIHLAEFIEPPLTTIRLSRNEIAQKAFAALLAGIEELPKEQSPRRRTRYTVDTSLVIRQTTGPVRKSRAVTSIV